MSTNGRAPTPFVFPARNPIIGTRMARQRVDNGELVGEPEYGIVMELVFMTDDNLKTGSWKILVNSEGELTTWDLREEYDRQIWRIRPMPLDVQPEEASAYLGGTHALWDHLTKGNQ